METRSLPGLGFGAKTEMCTYYGVEFRRIQWTHPWT